MFIKRPWNTPGILTAGLPAASRYLWMLQWKDVKFLTAYMHFEQRLEAFEKMMIFC